MKKQLLAAALACAVTSTSVFSQGLPTTGTLKSLPGKGWFTYFRLYGPTQPYFDRSWVLPDIEPVK